MLVHSRIRLEEEVFFSSSIPYLAQSFRMENANGSCMSPSFLGAAVFPRVSSPPVTAFLSIYKTLLAKAREVFVLIDKRFLEF